MLHTVAVGIVQKFETGNGNGEESFVTCTLSQSCAHDFSQKFSTNRFHYTV